MLGGNGKVYGTSTQVNVIIYCVINIKMILQLQYNNEHDIALVIKYLYATIKSGLQIILVVLPYEELMHQLSGILNPYL